MGVKPRNSWRAPPAQPTPPAPPKALHECWRIGLFGGSFDPPHLGHIGMAGALVRQWGIDALLVLPTPQPWHKDRVVTPFEHRVAMAQLAFEAVPQARVDLREASRDGPTFTMETIESIKAQAPQSELVLLMGQDQWLRLHTWHRCFDIAENAILVVAGRSSSALGNGPKSIGPFSPELHHPELPGVVARHLKWGGMGISSTLLRRGLTPGPLLPELQAYVPPAVSDYISRHGLYSS
jgi:nicotinate-nucleotide adenylyltransferase